MLLVESFNSMIFDLYQEFSSDENFIQRINLTMVDSVFWRDNDIIEVELWANSQHHYTKELVKHWIYHPFFNKKWIVIFAMEVSSKKAYTEVRVVSTIVKPNFFNKSAASILRVKLHVRYIFTC